VLQDFQCQIPFLEMFCGPKYGGIHLRVVRTGRGIRKLEISAASWHEVAPSVATYKTSVLQDGLDCLELMERRRSERFEIFVAYSSYARSITETLRMFALEYPQLTVVLLMP
jgi:hypothetical protein